MSVPGGPRLRAVLRRQNGAVHFVAGAVEREVADREAFLSGRGQMNGTAKQSPEPGDQLFEAERLGHVIVGARGQTGHPVHHRVARGQEKGRRVGP